MNRNELSKEDRKQLEQWLMDPAYRKACSEYYQACWREMESQRKKRAA